MTLGPEVPEGLEDRIKWINEVTELAAAENWRAVTKAIDELDLKDLRSLIHILVIARAGDLHKLRTLDARAERTLLS
jgi:hypothetical protein